MIGIFHLPLFNFASVKKELSTPPLPLFSAVSLVYQILVHLQENLETRHSARGWVLISKEDKGSGSGGNEVFFLHSWPLQIYKYPFSFAHFKRSFLRVATVWVAQLGY